MFVPSDNYFIAWGFLLYSVKLNSEVFFVEKRYDFTKVEKSMQEFWSQEQIYRFDKNATGEIYSIDTPPPTVSGKLFC